MERCANQFLPDCQAKWGLLTDVIQVKAEIALQQTTVNGFQLDLDQLKTMTEKTEQEARKVIDEINSLEHFSVCILQSITIPCQ